MAYASKAHLVTPRNALPLEYLREILSYDQDTGIFRCKFTRSFRVKVGDIIGSKTAGGYTCHYQLKKS